MADSRAGSQGRVDESHGATTPDGAVPEPPDLARRLALRPAELAQALGCSERLIRGQLHRIPHVRIGRALLFPIDCIRAWLVSQVKLDRVFNAIRTPVMAAEPHQPEPFMLPPGMQPATPRKIFPGTDFEIYWPSRIALGGFALFWAFVVILIGFVMKQVNRC